MKKTIAQTIVATITVVLTLIALSVPILLLRSAQAEHQRQIESDILASQIAADRRYLDSMTAAEQETKRERAEAENAENQRRQRERQTDADLNAEIRSYYSNRTTPETTIHADFD